MNYVILIVIAAAISLYLLRRFAPDTFAALGDRVRSVIANALRSILGRL